MLHVEEEPPLAHAGPLSGQCRTIERLLQVTTNDNPDVHIGVEARYVLESSTWPLCWELGGLCGVVAALDGPVLSDSSHRWQGWLVQELLFDLP